MTFHKLNNYVTAILTLKRAKKQNTKFMSVIFQSYIQVISYIEFRDKKAKSVNQMKRLTINRSSGCIIFLNHLFLILVL